MQPNVLWTHAMQWAVMACGLAKPPSRSAFYRWKTAMRKEFIRLARMAQGISIQEKKTVLTQHNAEILDVKFKIEQSRRPSTRAVKAAFYLKTVR